MADPGNPSEDHVLICNLSALTDADLDTVEALARLQLAARRCGLALRLRHACLPLRELLNLVGLSDVAGGPLRIEPGGQPEQGKQPGGVQESVHGHDAPG